MPIFLFHASYKLDTRKVWSTHETCYDPFKMFNVSYSEWSQTGRSSLLFSKFAAIRKVHEIQQGLNLSQPDQVLGCTDVNVLTENTKYWKEKHRSSPSC